MGFSVHNAPTIDRSTDSGAKKSFSNRLSTLLSAMWAIGGKTPHGGGDNLSLIRTIAKGIYSGFMDGCACNGRKCFQFSVFSFQLRQGDDASLAFTEN
jgi:hypothetical protein